MRYLIVSLVAAVLMVRAWATKQPHVHTLIDARTVAVSVPPVDVAEAKVPADEDPPAEDPVGPVFPARPVAEEEPSRGRLGDGLAPYPEWNGYDLDCPDIGRPVRVDGPDPHRLDRDGDGIGCESQ